MSQQDFAPENLYRPSSSPAQKETEVRSSFKIWGAQPKMDTPWADLAKKRTVKGSKWKKKQNFIKLQNGRKIQFGQVFDPLKVLYTNNGDKPLSNYSVDFVNGSVDARRNPIKPEQVSWTDRPKFEANSQYKASTLRGHGCQSPSIFSLKFRALDFQEACL